jgi:lysophospholipase L1-like esterase
MAHFNRRSMMIGTAGFSVAAMVGAAMPRVSEATPQQAAKGFKLAKGAKILFQGDSVTDAGRKKDAGSWTQNGALGNGYPALGAGQLMADYPDLELEIYNRGISGNKVPDLAARWQADAIDLKPTVLSVLIGINDYWHTIAFGSKYNGTVDDYEMGYRDLVHRSQEEIPGVRVVICEPFTLRDWPKFDPYRAVARKIAEEQELTFVPFQQAFEDAAKTVPKEFWLWDGIHPTPAGHALMVRAWRRTVGV